MQAHEIKLKELPDHLKYAYWGEKETLSVLISSKLTINQEESLVKVLKENKLEIGWKLVDIKGISPYVHA